MPELTISQLLRFHSRYLRSTHLERDFSDPTSLEGYIITPELARKFRRIATGTGKDSTARAWRVTGDYGTGKSSFALALAHLFSSDPSKLPGTLLRVIPRDLRSQRLFPVLVTGVREPMAIAILRGLHRALSETNSRGRSPRILDELTRTLDSSSETPRANLDNLVLSLLCDTATYLRTSGKASGLLLILDEVGKFLEYSAIRPDQQDVYLMQRLAECASRSGSTPILVIGLLHQGFNAYADQLAPSAQREWEKVSDRFEQLIFEQPLDQTVTLVADALRVKVGRLPSQAVAVARSDMRTSLALKCYGVDIGDKRLVEVAERLYPLHPTVIPPIVQLFSKFGQNERSLFSFLFSNEPSGLKSFSTRRANERNFYRLHHLYDYARASFGHRLTVQSYRSRWNHIDSVITSYPIVRELELKILKTIGLLNLLDGSVMPTEDLICLAVGEDAGNANEVRKALNGLQRRARLIYKRTTSNDYRLWSHTSLDLDRRYREALRAVGSSIRVTRTIRQHLESRPLVARRHYIQTGNLRHFEIRYVTAAELHSGLYARDRVTVPAGALAPPPADGQIVVALCDTEEERRQCLGFARTADLKSRPDLLIAISRPLNNLMGLVKEALAWEWIRANTPELELGDLARQEVLRMIATSQQVLQNRIHSFIGLQRHSGRGELEWFRTAERLPLASGRDILSFLSGLCDELYPAAPTLRNELVNRHQLSSAAAAAQMRLINRAFKYSSEPFLGLDPKKKPPEMSIYLSLFRNSGIHQRHLGKWRISYPTPDADVCRLLPALQGIDAFLGQRADQRVKVAELFDHLRRAPFGIRDGISPILLAVYSIVNEQHVALYDKGMFMTEVTELDYKRLAKWPGNFDVQLCRFTGVRSELFDRLIEALKLSRRTEKNELLDIVRPLCSFVAQLSAYTQRTGRLSDTAKAVRSALTTATEPGPLLFQNLPVACGFREFRSGERRTREVRKFVIELRDAVDELRRSYPRLQDRLKKRLIRTFQLDSNLGNARKALRARAVSITSSVTDAKLKAFCNRLCDQNLPDGDWIVALGSVVVEIPPSKWRDEHEQQFSQELDNLAKRFQRVEQLTFEDGRRLSNTIAMHVAVTSANGDERGKVIFANKSEQQKINTIEKKLQTALGKKGNLELAALASVFWHALAADDK